MNLSVLSWKVSWNALGTTLKYTIHDLRYDHSSSDMEVQGKREEHPNITQRPRRGSTEHPHRLHRGFAEDSQRTRRELTEDSQRTHRGLTEDSQRIHRGLIEDLQPATVDSQRTHRGLTENP